MGNCLAPPPSLDVFAVVVGNYAMTISSSDANMVGYELFDATLEIGNTMYLDRSAVLSELYMFWKRRRPLKGRSASNHLDGVVIQFVYDRFENMDAATCMLFYKPAALHAFMRSIRIDNHM